MAVHHLQDVRAAQEGGADRLALVAPGETAGLSPDVAAASAVLRAAELPVRVMLRLNDTTSTTGGEFTRLIGLAEEYLSLGAEGVVFGFLDADLEVDVETCEALARALPAVPWTFHRAIDAALDPRRAWRQVKHLPGLTAVRSGGSPQGLAHGYDDLLALASGDPDVARLLMPAGGLLAEHVPWFARAGVTQFHVGVAGAPRPHLQVLRRRGLRALVAHPAGLFGWGAAGGLPEGGPVILIDPPAVPAHGRLWSHLVSDTSYDELHEFAAAHGIPARGFERDHYDVPDQFYDRLVEAGAVPVSSRELVGRLVRAGLRRRKSEPG